LIIRGERARSAAQREIKTKYKKIKKIKSLLCCSERDKHTEINSVRVRNGNSRKLLLM
jgi:hypothetical protein